MLALSSKHCTLLELCIKKIENSTRLSKIEFIFTYLSFPLVTQYQLQWLLPFLNRLGRKFLTAVIKIFMQSHKGTEPSVIQLAIDKIKCITHVRCCSSQLLTE